jgi:hypothetical protein
MLEEVIVSHTQGFPNGRSQKAFVTEHTLAGCKSVCDSAGELSEVPCESHLGTQQGPLVVE